MSIPDLSRFQFSGGENAAPIEDLSTLPEEARVSYENLEDKV